MDETVAVYTVMEDALMAGKTRAIGVSNFNVTVRVVIVPPTTNSSVLDCVRNSKNY